MRVGEGLFLGLELPDALPGSRIQGIQVTVQRTNVDHALRYCGRAGDRVLHLELPPGLARAAVQREDTPVLQAKIQPVPSDSRRRMDGTRRAYLPAALSCAGIQSEERKMAADVEDVVHHHRDGARRGPQGY